MKVFTAEHVLPISSDPISNGAVAIDDSGRIAAVGALDQIKDAYPAAEFHDFGAAAILPGFVNCHSHLEITSLRGALDDVEADFKSWLLKITSLRQAMDESDIDDSALFGALEGAAAGVTCFGDIGREASAAVKALKQVGLRGIVYQETSFSPDNRTADADFATLGKKFEKLRDEQDELVTIGLSPHSPYTVSSRLMELIAEYSILNRIPLTIHAAESVHEEVLLQNGDGLFAEFFSNLDFEWISPRCSSIEYLERIGMLSARPLLAHCVRISDTDIDRLTKYRIPVAHCPKSNAKFGHGIAPIEKLLDAGITVGIGTDSMASNNVCDMIDEARIAAFAARSLQSKQRFVSAKDVLYLATLGGAKALRLESDIGSLECGKFADIAVVSLSHPSQQPISDIYAAIVFSSNARDVAKTFVRGKVVYSAAD